MKPLLKKKICKVRLIKNNNKFENKFVAVVDRHTLLRAGLHNSMNHQQLRSFLINFSNRN